MTGQAAAHLAASVLSLTLVACERETEPLRPDLTAAAPGPASGEEPPGLAVFNDQPWTRVQDNGWSYLRRTASKDSDIVIDVTAPGSAPEALRMVFTPDMARDSEPGVHWIRLPGVREVHADWLVKWSRNWTCSPAGCGKIGFFRTEGEGNAYINYGDFGRTGRPHTISVNTQWAPYGQRVWPANRAFTTITPGRWYRVEWHLRHPSRPGAADGAMQWWVDGVLNGEYTDMRFPAAGFVQFEFAPTLQNPPPTEQYMYVDHVRISVR
jgi:hypothetical protein